MGLTDFLRRVRDWLTGGASATASGLPRLSHDAAPRLTPVVPMAMPSASIGSSVAQRDESKSRRARIHAAFDTGMPVETRAGLAGRSVELDRLVEAVIEHGKHGIVFGARGSGKTSLSRVFGDVADEQGAIVLYNLASGDLSFSDLYRPYLTELVTIPGGTLRQGDIAPLLDAPFDARHLASLLAERMRRPLILVLDEFDRVVSAATKAEVAALMKLLTDMRATTRVVAVGIAANVEDLIEGHPSLRRHMVSVPVAGIGVDPLKQLLIRCCEQAGLTIHDNAASQIAAAAIGSPYHLRLFGLNCALAAERAGVSVIDAAIVRQGLTNAFVEWRTLSVSTADLLIRCASLDAGPRFATALIAYAAAMRTRIDRTEIETLGAEDGSVSSADFDMAFAALAPILTASALHDQYLFEDALAPQFYLLLQGGKIDLQSSERGLRGDLRNLLDQGARPE